jgi:hypothetical protein
MSKMVVHTKFNKTGKRILTTPLQEEGVCAPANRKYGQARNRIETEFKKKWHYPQDRYVDTLSSFIVSYVSNKSSAHEEVYELVKFLAVCSIKATGSRIGIHMGSNIWLQKLGNIPGLAELEAKAWQTCQKEFKTLLEKRETALKKASNKHDEMKRQLWREISDEIHRQFHPEDNGSLR